MTHRVVDAVVEMSFALIDSIAGLRHVCKGSPLARLHRAGGRAATYTCKLDARLVRRLPRRPSSVASLYLSLHKTLAKVEDKTICFASDRAPPTI